MKAKAKCTEHHVDMQGLCHGCGVLLNEDAWDAYTGHDRVYWIRETVKAIRRPILILSPKGRSCTIECALRDISATELLAFMKRGS